MQYDENAEKYGYEGEMTPMKCDELKAYKADVTIPVYGSIADAQVYLKEKADAAIAELKGQVNGFKNQTKLWEYNALNEHNAAVEVRIENEKLKAKLAEKDKEIAELKQKLESVQASMYADVVDANMEVRRLKRALYKACANWAHHRVFVRFKTNEKDWENMERKCRAKAEEYK